MNSVNIVAAAGAADSAEYARPAAASGPQQPGPGFSDILGDMMRDRSASAGVAAGGFPYGMTGFLPPQNQGIEQAIASAASSGQEDDAQMALLMLCMIMQSDQDGDFSMIMQMMGTMLTKMQGDKEALRGNVMSSGYDAYILDLIDKGVFKTRMPELSGTGGAVMPVEQWKPAVPAITSSPASRSPELYRAVIEQFQVGTAERYRPFRNGSTYCNIYVWDVTRAMGAEIPLYTDPSTGEPRYYPDTKGARSMGATAMDQWLSAHGREYGWREVDAETAQMYANSGTPAVTTAGSMGHVQVVCPSRDGGFDKIRGVTVAQAGRIVTDYTHISSIYGTNSLNNSVRYWVYGR